MRVPLSRSLIGVVCVVAAVATASAATAQTPRWLKLCGGSSPPPRGAHSVAYDTATQRMIISGGLGGSSSDSLLQDTWYLSLSDLTWHQMPDAPVARAYHSAVYDPGHTRMFVFGGETSTTVENAVLNDVLTLSLGGTPAWNTLVPGDTQCPTTDMGITKPCRRKAQAAVYDDTVIVFGGASCDSSDEHNDTWTISDTTWTHKSGYEGCDFESDSSTGEYANVPDKRAYHSLIWDSNMDRIVVCAGDYDPTAGFSNAFYTADHGATWQKLLHLNSIGHWTHQAPFLLQKHSAVYDVSDSQMVIFGGQGMDGISQNTTWVLSLPSTYHGGWSTMTTSGTPSARHSHTAIYDTVHHRMIVFGGFVRTTVGTPRDSVVDETWVLDLGGCSITPTDVSDLEVKGVGTNHVYLRWTAPNLGAVCGPAYTYDIRYSTSEIDGSNFGSATHLTTGLVPSSPGAKDSVDVTGLSNHTQYFLALKTSSYCGNWSALSNQACAITGSPGSVCYPEARFQRETPPVISALALGRIQPNPNRGQFAVSFTLPDGRPATIDVVDIAGRKVRSFDVGAMGAGQHSVSFGSDRVLAPGYYLLRLRHAESQLTTRAIVLK